MRTRLAGVFERSVFLESAERQNREEKPTSVVVSFVPLAVGAAVRLRRFGQAAGVASLCPARGRLWNCDGQPRQPRSHYSLRHGTDARRGTVSECARRFGGNCLPLSLLHWRIGLWHRNRIGCRMRMLGDRIRDDAWVTVDD